MQQCYPYEKSGIDRTRIEVKKLKEARVLRAPRYVKKLFPALRALKNLITSARQPVIMQTEIYDTTGKLFYDVDLFFKNLFKKQLILEMDDQYP